MRLLGSFFTVTSKLHMHTIGGRMEVEPQLLLRVRVPQPTRAHPLQGLYRGVYGAHGIQVLVVEYSFVGRAAGVRATKVLIHASCDLLCHQYQNQLTSACWHNKLTCCIAASSAVTLLLAAWAPSSTVCILLHCAHHFAGVPSAETKVLVLHSKTVLS